MSGMMAGTGKIAEIHSSTGRQAPRNTAELKEQLEEKIKLLWEIMDGKNGGTQLETSDLSVEGRDAVRTVMLLHDLHKVFPGRGFEHYELPQPLKKGDILASMMARNKVFSRKDFKENNNRLRYSLGTRMPVSGKEPGKNKLFRETAAAGVKELHGQVMEAEGLMVLNEAKMDPFTSLKHHLLLACALAENFVERGNAELKGLVLCVDDKKPGNRYKIVGRCYGKKKKKKYWMWIDSRYCGGGNAHLSTDFNGTWNNMVGVETSGMIRGYLVRAVRSWTAGLALLEKGKEKEQIDNSKKLK